METSKEIGFQNNWEQMKEQASVLVKSGFLPPSIKTPEQAMAIGLAGKELGIPFTEAVRSINIIQGKPCISPQLMLALANRNSLLTDIKFDSNDQRCIVIVTRKDRSPHTEEFGIKEATALGLIGKDNYRKQPAIMFRWRCVAAALRIVFPDVLLGTYTPEELGAEVKVNDEGEMQVIDIPTSENINWINTGVRPVKEYWDSRDQALLGGEGFEARKTPQGWYIFADEKVLKEKTPDFMDQRPPDEFITHAQVLELFKEVKERGIDLEIFKKYLTEELGVSGTNKITKDRLNTVTEWIIRATVGA